MGPRERGALLSMCAVVAVTTAVGVLALDHWGILDLTEATPPPPVAEASHDILPPAPTLAQRPAERLAFMPSPGTPLLRSTVIEDAAEDDDVTAEVESPESWSADTRPAAEPSDPPSAETRHSAWDTRLSAWRTQRTRVPVPGAPQRSYTLAQRLAEISPAATARLVERFKAAEASWPPAEIGLVALKDEKVLELYARPQAGEWKLVHRYRVLAASGRAGPKLLQGDRQVPEGVYAISFLNPNSRYHVSLRVNYPNAFDREMAKQDGRKQLGGDIMIHGKASSIGCLAIGDPASEELFVLAAQTGLKNVKLVIAPTDFRRHGVPKETPGQPAWVPRLYTEVASAMTPFKAPPPQSLLSFLWN